jgi:uncharacterized membrane protein YjjB (DUF3815 family)
MIFSVITAGIASGAFSIFFNIRGINTLFAAINGTIGFLIFSLLTQYGLASYIAMLFASMAMAAYAEILARLRKAPASLFLVAGIIPIVPGGGIFEFALSFIQGDNDMAVSIGIRTLLEAGSIALGIIIVSSVVKLLLSGKK